MTDYHIWNLDDKISNCYKFLLLVFVAELNYIIT